VPECTVAGMVVLVSRAQCIQVHTLCIKRTSGMDCSSPAK